MHHRTDTASATQQFWEMKFMRRKDVFGMTELLVFKLFHAVEPTAEGLWRRKKLKADIDYWEVRIWKDLISDIPQVSVEF
jgi:hypothetical protein